MKSKINEKTNPKSGVVSEDCEIISVSWEDSLGKEVQSFWESIDEEFEE